MLSGVTGIRAALAASGGADMMGPITPSEQAPFLAIAKAKGVKLTFEHGTVTAMGAAPKGRLDMDTANTSITLAANRADKAGYTNIAAKLRKLATAGTSAQKSEFLTGSGKYYFPAHIEKAVGSVHAMGGVTCQQVCTYACMCLTCQSPMDHCCQEICRNICREICS